MQPSDMNRQFTIAGRAESILATNAVLRNTYLLLGLTLLFSGGIAALATSLQWRGPGILLFFVGAYGLLFLTTFLRNSVWGLLSTFAFTGFMGYALAPILEHVLRFSNGGQLIMTALGGTGLVFFALSAYALTTRKDFSFMSSFIVVGSVVALIAMIAGLFLHMPAFHLVISGIFMLLASAVILWQTGEIVNGGETNYIMATITLYVQIYNLFVSLLQILSAFNGRE